MFVMTSMLCSPVTFSSSLSFSGICRSTERWFDSPSHAAMSSAADLIDAKILQNRKGRQLVQDLEEAVNSTAAMPAVVEKRIRDAFRRSRGVASLGMGAVFEKDDPTRELVKTGAEVRKQLGVIGGLTQQKFRGEGCCPTAFAAFCDVFFHQQETLRGRDGGEWLLKEELTWPVFLEALDAMGRGKALGADEISVDWIRRSRTWVKRLFYQGLLKCAESRDFPEEWMRIIYVLLRKKRGDQRLVAKRRDIALMAHTMKLLGKMVHIEAYARIQNSLDPSQVGWRAAHGATDAATTLAHVIETAARLRTPMFLLYVDLRTFFPALHRQVIAASELLHGLPPTVVKLVCEMYAESVGQYDSKHGLSEAFDIDNGGLMGCVLSPDRAKFVLDLATVAICMICKGAKVWARSDRRRILSILCADDWVGTFNEASDMIMAWEIWQAWAAASGCTLGVEGFDKTTYSGVRYDAEGKPMEAPCPALYLASGEVLRRLPCDKSYRHMGFPRQICGSMVDAIDSLKRTWRARVHSLAGFNLREKEFIRVSNIICLGLAAFYGTGVFLSRTECDGLEAEWRVLFNRRYSRPNCTPRFTLYAEANLAQPDEISGAKGIGDFNRRDGDKRRVHLYAAMSAALISNTFKMLGDSADSDARTATEQAVGLSFYSWGCRTAPEQ